MDTTLTQMYESGKCSVADIANALGVTVQAVYYHMHRLGLPLLGVRGCKLRNYRSYGPRYNEIVFSKGQTAMIRRRNAEGWSDSKIARELGVPAGPVRKVRKRLGLLTHIRKLIPVGRRYGNLVVLKVLSPKNRKEARPNCLSSCSLCRCDCGSKKVVFNENLRCGRTKTCGCHINFRKIDSEWTKVFHSYVSSATARRVKFTLSFEQVKYICSLPCYYCDAIESNVIIISPNGQGSPSRTPLRYNGIDQVVALAGYRPGNVLRCCCFCNRAKSSQSLEKFLPWINRILRRVSRRNLTTGSVRKAAAALGKQLKQVSD